MQKILRSVVGCLAVALLFVLVSCELFAPKPALGELQAPEIVADGEALVLTWRGVDGATAYDLFFTDDGSLPAPGQQGISNVQSPYTHTGLTATKTYKYMLRARAEGYDPAQSAVTDGIQPLPVITFNITFADYANKPVLLLMLDVPYDPVIEDVTGNTTLVETIPGMTNASGSLTIRGTVDRTRYWGFTVVKDLDSNEQLSTGDIVWGTGGAGSFSYSYWSSILTYSFVVDRDWDASHGGNNHIY